MADEFDLTADEIDAALEYYDANPDEMAALAADAATTRERLGETSRAPK